MGVLDAGVGAEGPGGRHLVGRVPGQEHPALSVPFGDPLGGVPGGPAGDLHVEVGHPDGLADVGDAPLVGERLEGLSVLGVPGGVEHPVLPVVDRQQGAVRLRVGEVADDEPPVPDVAGEVTRAEREAHVVEQVARTLLPDAQRLTHRAARAVGGDEVVRPDPGVLTGLPALDQRRHALRVLLEGQHLRPEAQVPAELPGSLENHRLEVVLAAQAPPGGAEAGDAAARVDLLEQPLPSSPTRLEVCRMPWLSARVDAARPMRCSRPAVRNSSMVRTLFPVRGGGATCPRGVRRACAARRGVPGTGTWTGPPGSRRR